MRGVDWKCYYFESVIQQVISRPASPSPGALPSDGDMYSKSEGGGSPGALPSEGDMAACRTRAMEGR